SSRRRSMVSALAALCLSSLGICLPELADGTAFAAGRPCEAEILHAADRYGVPAGILYAVGLTETGNKGSMHPNALNIEGKSIFPSTRNEALLAFREARRQGKTLID